MKKRQALTHLRQFFQHHLILAAAALLLPAVALYFLVFRHMYYEPAAEERSRVGRNWAEDGFSVAIVWPAHTDLSLVQGVTLAWEEVNAGGGPLANKIRMRFLTERNDGGAMARDVARRRDVVAVIGHEFGDNAIPASLTYEDHGILFLSPKSTNTRLTTHDFNFVFRLTPADTQLSEDMVKFAIAQQWKRVGIFYGRHDHGSAISALLLTKAAAAGLTVPFVHSYLPAGNWLEQDFRPAIAEMLKSSFDAILLGDELPWAAKVLIDMSSMRVTMPVLATDKLDSALVWDLAREAGNNLYVASGVDPSSTSAAYLAFKQRFRQRFGGDPGYGASQGYEAFTLFVNACLISKSAEPIIVSTTIRTGRWQGLFGEFAFLQNGEIVGRDVSIKRMVNVDGRGEFKTEWTSQRDVQ